MFRGVDEGLKNTTLPLSKRGRTALSDRATLSDFDGSECENVSENRNVFDEIESSEVVDEHLSTSAIDRSQVSFQSLIASCIIPLSKNRFLILEEWSHRTICIEGIEPDKMPSNSFDSY